MEQPNALVVRDLSYRYPDGRRGLSGVTIEVERGMRVALVGKNGSGKTTLLLHINGLLDGKGHISVMGIVRNRKTMREIRSKVGYLFSQVEYQFIMPDLISDVMLGLSGGKEKSQEARDAAMEWLRRFNLERYAEYSPLDLSAGEMKRAALAGILAGKPDLLLLDEPLNNLDRESGDDLISLLADTPATMLIATHRLHIVKGLATHVAVMKNGAVTAFLSNTDALRDEEVLNLLC